MKEYTLVEALKDCITMWSWLAAHPSKNKWHFKILNKTSSNCACCEYTKEFSLKTCDNCPLVGLWSAKKDFSCLCTFDYYNKYCYAKSLKTKKKYALKILNAAKRRLEDFSYALN